MKCLVGFLLRLRHRDALAVQVTHDQPVVLVNPAAYMVRRNSPPTPPADASALNARNNHDRAGLQERRDQSPVTRDRPVRPGRPAA